MSHQPPKRQWTAPGYNPIPEPPPTRGNNRRETLIAICTVLACTVLIGIAVVASIVGERDNSTITPKPSEKSITSVKPTLKPSKAQPTRSTQDKRMSRSTEGWVCLGRLSVQHDWGRCHARSV